MGAGNTLKKAKQEGKGEGKTQGLGKALMRQRFRQAPQKFVNDDGMVKNNFLSDQEERNMKSVTQESDLESFLQKAELADHDFTAERLSISIVTSYQQTQTAEEKETMKRMHLEYADALQIPKRPDWKTLTKDELIKKEKEEFLNWRRSLVFLEEEKGLILTPYERNIEVWRQLWRVIERSELVVQIVDARHVMFFRSEDLEKYVSKDSQKVNLLLVNKSDLLTPMQRVKWAEYFEKNNIQYRFFSAHMARDELELERLIVDKFGQQLEFETLDQKEEYLNQYGQDILSKEYAEKLNERENVHPKARIINAIELSKLIDELCPNSEYSLKNGKRTVGFVGYPNVGKSSTLNALIGAQKVAVGSTPGKTKHFQTIHLSDQIILCDCPGLVFPSFATTKAEMVINGVLPIDQLRDHVGPGNLIGERIPKFYLEKIYGIQIKTRNTEGDLCYRPCTAEELFSSYANARGFAKSSQGNPDEARAARYILKDYVSGKLLFVHPPPNIDQIEFNSEMYKDEILLKKQQDKLKIVDETPTQQVIYSNEKSQKSLIDLEFFHKIEVKAKTKGNAMFESGDFTRVKAFPYQEGSEKTIGGKKEHKKKPREKTRVNWTKME